MSEQTVVEIKKNAGVELSAVIHAAQQNSSHHAIIQRLLDKKLEHAESKIVGSLKKRKLNKKPIKLEESISHQINIDLARIESYSQPISVAIILDNVNAVKMLIEKGIDLNTIPGTDLSPAGLAIFLGKLDILKLFLDAGADVNYLQPAGFQPGGFTLLQMVVNLENECAIKMLLAAGADSQSKNSLGVSAQDLAISTNNPKIISLFPRTEIESVQNLLLEAIMRKLYSSIPTLLHKRTKTNCSLSNFELYERAIACNDINAVKILITHKVYIDSKNADGLTPLGLALRINNLEIAKLLLEKGANPNCKDNQDYPLLYYEILAGNDSAVELLLAYGAQKDFKDKEGRNLSELALEIKHDKIAALVKVDTLETRAPAPATVSASPQRSSAPGEKEQKVKTKIKTSEHKPIQLLAPYCSIEFFSEQPLVKQEFKRHLKLTEMGYYPIRGEGLQENLWLHVSPDLLDTLEERVKKAFITQLTKPKGVSYVAAGKDHSGIKKRHDGKEEFRLLGKEAGDYRLLSTGNCQTETVLGKEMIVKRFEEIVTHKNFKSITARRAAAVL